MPVYKVEAGLRLGQFVLLGRLGDVAPLGYQEDLGDDHRGGVEGDELHCTTFEVVGPQDVSTIHVVDYVGCRDGTFSAEGINQSPIRGRIRYVKDLSAKGRPIILGHVLPRLLV